MSYPVISGVDVPNEFWDGLKSWRPNYWTKLPLDVREEIDAKTQSYACSLFERSPDYWSYRYWEYQEERGADYALQTVFDMGVSHYWGLCIDALKAREKDLAQGRSIRCGAKKHNGQRCMSYVLKGKNRCRFHGGGSTGPKTLEGKLRSLAQLPQYRKRPGLLEAKRKELLGKTRAFDAQQAQ